MLGLLTEFKDKDTKKITTWGYISLAGIVVSTILGTAAQLKESVDDAAQALALAKKTDTTLLEVRRSLASIEESEAWFDLDVDCTNERYVDFCRKTKALREKQWLYFDDIRGLFPHHDGFALDLRFDIFVDPKDAQKLLSGNTDYRGDWSFYVSVPLHHDEDGTIDLQQRAGNVIRLSIFSAKEVNPYNNGKVNGLIDLPNATFVVTDFSVNDTLEGLIPQYFEIKIKNGQSIDVKGPFTPVSIGGQPGLYGSRAFICKFPPETD